MPWSRSTLHAPLLALAVACVPVIDGAHAQSPGSEEAPAGRVDLDRLLKLPETLDFDVERRGGRTRREWLALFGEVQRSVDEAREGLADAQARLAAMAGRSDNWNMAPPGLPIEAAEDNPDTRGLREEVARRRAEITRAEARQREVQIEASLAGVPEDWRRPQAQIGSENRSPRRDDSAP